MRAMPTLAAAALAATLAGCVTGQDIVAHDPFLYRDPLINGPFLVGPRRPYVKVGDCRPIGDIRSQDARLGYKPCPRVYPYNGAINPHDPPVGIVTEPVPEAYEESDLKAPPYRRDPPPVPRQDNAVARPARSAW